MIIRLLGWECKIRSHIMVIWLLVGSAVTGQFDGDGVIFPSM